MVRTTGMRAVAKAEPGPDIGEPVAEGSETLQPIALARALVLLQSGSIGRLHQATRPSVETLTSA